MEVHPPSDKLSLSKNPDFVLRMDGLWDAASEPDCWPVGSKETPTEKPSTASCSPSFASTTFGGGFFSTGSLEERIQDVQEKQLAQDQMLHLQRREYLALIEELRRELQGGERSPSKEEAENMRLNPGSEDLQPRQQSFMSKALTVVSSKASRKTVQPNGCDEVGGIGCGVAYYEFSQSMWDAAILCFFREINVADKCVLLLGIIINHLLQGLLLAVVYFDMLDNPYPTEKIEMMLQWRVNTGHSHVWFDEINGKSKLQRLCNQSLWTFEQAEYEEMYQYLYKPIPGYWLSLLALILWVLTTMVEYRNAVEQALAIFHLPAPQEGRGCIVKDSGGKVHLVAIRWPARILGLLLLCLPRVGAVFVIQIVGCEYLAQTPSLADIVLNACALAFVLDVDEHLYSVLCTQRIRTIVENLNPLPCSETSIKVFGTLQVKDVVRYVLTVSTIFFVYNMYLVPFHANVEGAATALCGGLHDFTYQGGSVVQQTVWLHNSSDYCASCMETGSEYFNSFYGEYFTNVTTRMDMMMDSVVETDLTPVREKVVLNYAFSKGCAPGEVLQPPAVHEDGEAPLGQRQCKPLPKMLGAVLPESVSPGRAPAYPRCNQFQPELGWDTCSPRDDGEACLWSSLSTVCEKAPPGDLQRAACTNETMPTLQTVARACAVWEKFGHTNPMYNCRITTMCRGQRNSDCFIMRGTIHLDMTKSNAIDTLADMEQVSLVGVRAVLVRMARLPQEKITTTWAGTNKRYHGQDWLLGPQASLAVPKNSTRTSVDYEFSNCPFTFLPENFFSGDYIGQFRSELLNIAGTGRNESINRALVQISFNNTQFLTSHEREAEKALALGDLYSSSSVESVESP